MAPIGVLGIVVAALGGAAVGVERQRSGHASGAQARLGGVRTFTLLGGVAGLAGWLTSLQMVGLAVALTAGAVAIVVAGYIAASARDVDATTETAALVVIAAGLAAGMGWLALASGVIAVCTLLLVEKSQLHALVGRIADEELRAAARFGVMAVVVLPLLPEGPFGPFGGIRPRELWLLVLFFTGLSFAGYLARRMFGAERGYPFAGLLGGIVSSTNVTFTFARLSRRERMLSGPLALGAVGACTMLFPRVMIAASVLNLSVAKALLPYLVVPFAVGIITLYLWWRTNTDAVGPADMPVESAADRARAPDGGGVSGCAVRRQRRPLLLRRARTAFLRGGAGPHRRRRAHDFHGADCRRGRRGGGRRQGDRRRHPDELPVEDGTGRRPRQQPVSTRHQRDARSHERHTGRAPGRPALTQTVRATGRVGCQPRMFTASASNSTPDTTA